VPYATVAMPNKAHTPVIIPPMGKIKILVPGRTNGVAVADDAVVVLAEAAEAAEAASVDEFVWSAKTPLTKVASLEARVVLAVVPEEVAAERVTTGMTRPWRVVLGIHCYCGGFDVWLVDLRVHIRSHEVLVDLADKGIGLD